MVKLLWQNCPALRVAKYTTPLYEGENALHVAIALKLPRKILELLLSDPLSTKTLLQQKAKGTFFTKDACSTGKELNLGETPLGFAACTNQQEYFDMLLEASSACSAGGATQKKEGAHELKRQLLMLVTEVEMDDRGVKTDGYSPPSNGPAFYRRIDVQGSDKVERALRVQQQERRRRRGSGRSKTALVLLDV